MRPQLTEIYTESNPNPNSLKFVANYSLLPSGESVDFPDKETAKVSPLATKLFELPYVERVFFMNNFVTVTKAESMPWEEITLEVKEEIRTFLNTDQPLFTAAPPAKLEEEAAEENHSEMDQKIQSILDEYVKPAVEMDGGAIVFKSFEEETGKLNVQLQGSCSGCPSSMVTLKSGIENLMQRLIPEVKSVVAEEV